MSTKLTQNAIKLNARKFSENWKDETYERGEAQSFYNDFFEIFGVRRRAVARYEEHVRKLDNSSGFIDLFWPGVLIAEHKSFGADLDEATIQVNDYFDALPEESKPRFRLVCDFQTFSLTDLDLDFHVVFPLSKLEDNINHFNFILGRERPTHDFNEPLNSKAAKLVAKLYAILLKSRYSTLHKEQLLVRLVFCMFADVTGIFEPRGVFLDLLEAETAEDGSNLGACLAQLFQTLSIHENDRQNTLSENYKNFPYINGDLFKDSIPMLSANKSFRAILIEAAQFNWATISPAIFGALFQSILVSEGSREPGGQPTSETNILKVLDGIALNDLRAELETCRSGANRIRKLNTFREKLSTLNFLDPCCGCGNFLAVAYREIRRIEIKAIEALAVLKAFDPLFDPISLVNVDQFYGIELLESAARIAEVSLWMTDHLMNNESSNAFGVVYSRIPLKRAPKILVGDALELSLDWNSLLTSKECQFVVGNPPYLGSKIKNTEKKRGQLSTLAGIPLNSGTLDFAAGWILKTAKYLNREAMAAFVVTSSLTQGEQVGQLFPVFFNCGCEIEFAHQTFNWESLDSDGPQVDVVIIGFSKSASRKREKLLFEYETGKFVKKTKCSAISPYLRVGDNLHYPNLVVSETNTPINGAASLKTGTKPIDGGYYILSEEEKHQLIKDYPRSKNYIRPFIGGREFLQGTCRYIIYIADDKTGEYKRIPPIFDRVKKVVAYRKGEITQKDGSKKRAKNEHDTLAAHPDSFHITTIPTSPFLVIPEVSSENRKYIPIAWEKPPTIPSNLVKVLVNASLPDFALLSSAMHMAWVRTIGGRLESRYRYSIRIIYNNFPRPNIGLESLARIAQRVLDERDKCSIKSLEEMYDPRNMPPLLVKAHMALDIAVDKLYRQNPFIDDQDRFVFLMNRYSDLISRK